MEGRARSSLPFRQSLLLIAIHLPANEASSLSRIARPCLADRGDGPFLGMKRLMIVDFGFWIFDGKSGWAVAGLRSTFNIQHSSFIIHHSSFIIHHSSFIIQHSTFNIQHSTFNIQHSTFNIRCKAAQRLITRL